MALMRDQYVLVRENGCSASKRHTAISSGRGVPIFCLSAVLNREDLHNRSELTSIRADNVLDSTTLDDVMGTTRACSNLCVQKARMHNNKVLAAVGHWHVLGTNNSPSLELVTGSLRTLGRDVDAC